MVEGSPFRPSTILRSRMAESLDIEQSSALVAYLQTAGRIERQEVPTVTVLSGGVSNRTVRVDRSNGESWVIKQALGRLRVKEDWFSDPSRIRRESLGLQWIGRLVPWEAVPLWLFEDPENHLLAMRAVPDPSENWKTRLLAGHVELTYVEAFGHLLGTIHDRSRERLAELPPELRDRSFFKSLRIEPYYRFSATRNPIAAPFLDRLIEETMATRISLVHGDYSPKNVIIHGERLVLLDFEVVHFGDPAFDLGFALTHFLSKARHLNSIRPVLLFAALRFWESYRSAAPALGSLPGLESRAVSHALACLLARVDGRSPLEYLTEIQRREQRNAVLAAIHDPPQTVASLIDRLRIGN
jgi:5-methylthioribose kinase